MLPFGPVQWNLYQSKLLQQGFFNSNFITVGHLLVWFLCFVVEYQCEFFCTPCYTCGHTHGVIYAGKLMMLHMWAYSRGNTCGHTHGVTHAGILTGLHMRAYSQGDTWGHTHGVTHAGVLTGLHMRAYSWGYTCGHTHEVTHADILTRLHMRAYSWGYTCGYTHKHVGPHGVTHTGILTSFWLTPSRGYTYGHTHELLTQA